MMANIFFIDNFCYTELIVKLNIKISNNSINVYYEMDLD